MRRKRPDLLVDVALYLWHAHVKPMLAQLRSLADNRGVDFVVHASTVAADGTPLPLPLPLPSDGELAGYQHALVQSLTALHVVFSGGNGGRGNAHGRGGGALDDAVLAATVVLVSPITRFSQLPAAVLFVV